MKEFVIFFLVCFFGNTVHAQKISLVEYDAHNLVSYPKEVEMNINWKKDTDRISLFFTTVHHSEIAVNTPLLKATLNSRLLLVDSFIVYDEFGDHALTGFIKDTNGGAYEEQPIPIGFYSLGGVKSGTFYTYLRSYDSALAPLFTETVVNYRQGLMHGKFARYYPYSTQLEFEFSYENGEMTGDYNQYRKDGTYSEKGQFLRNQKQREYTWYYENNQPSKKEVYENGKLHGEAKAWHRNGKTALITTYENGQPNGFYYTYYDNGQIKDSLFYLRGQLQGRIVKYHRNGQKSFECTYDNGLEQSPLRIWNQDGILIREAEYMNGNREGMEKIYSEKGVLMQSIFIYNDISFIETIFYHPNGKMKCRTRNKITERKITEECWDEKGRKISNNTSSTEIQEEEVPEIRDDGQQDGIINEEIDQQEMVVMVQTWENPTIILMLPLSEEGKKAFAKAKGIKFIAETKNNSDYTVTLHPDHVKDKKGKKLLPLLQKSLEVRPLKINGGLYPTRITFVIE